MLTTCNLCTGYTWTSLGSTPWLVRMQPDHATDTTPPGRRSGLHSCASSQSIGHECHDRSFAIKLELLAVGKPLGARERNRGYKCCGPKWDQCSWRLMRA